MLNWDDLRVFLAAYREGSIGRAAERLGVSGSTVSRRLTTLEEALGHSLFVRSPDGLKPTRAGTRVAADAEEAELHVTRMQFGIGEVDSLSGSVRVSTSSELLYSVILPNWPSFADNHPNLSVEFIESTQLADLERWEADIAIRGVRPQGGDNLVVTRLRESTVGVFGARGLLEARGIDVADTNALRGVAQSLAEWPWVDWTSDYEELPIARARVNLVPNARVVMRLGSLESIRLAAAAGVGLAIVPSYFGRVSPSLVGIHELRDREPTILYLVGHAAVLQTARVRAVWDALRTLLRGSDDAQIDEGKQAIARAYGIRFPAG